MDEDRAASDRRLVESVLAGNADEFARIVERYQRLAASVAWRYGLRAEDIEDAVSEIFVKTWENLHRYRPDHPLSTWIYRLAVNHVIDRKRRGRRERGRDELPANLADGRPGAERTLELDERAILARRTLAELPDHYRAVMFLVYVEGRSVEETSRILGLPTGTVKSRLLRGRETMRRTLVRRHPEHFGAPS